MDEEYDAIILGTGLTECILGGLLSVEGWKVLQMDRNSYYGGSAASMNLKDLYKKFDRSLETFFFSKYAGNSRDWSVDLVPKFLMAQGKLVKLLIHTKVTRYLEFNVVKGSYVYSKGKVHKIPSSESEALSSSLLSLFQKYKFKNMLSSAIKFDVDDISTHDKVNPGATMKEVYDSFGLGQPAQQMTGHSIALHATEDYLKESCVETIKKIQLYYNSLGSFGGSPYLYPMYGLGELPQGFARLSAVYGGTFMLRKPIDNIVLKDDKVHVTSQGETAKAKIVIGDPSYFPEKVEAVGKVVRAYCVLDHPIHNTDHSPSCQVILPQLECDRKHDIYISCVGFDNKVAPIGKYMAIVCTTVETDDPESELKPALDLLEPITDKIVTVDDVYEQPEDEKGDKIFISKSYDASTHFETTCDDIIDLYERITKKRFNFEEAVVDFDEDDATNE